MTQVNVLNAKEKTSGNLLHRCQLAKPGDLQLIRNAEEGRARFLTDTARDAAKHLIKESHTYTHKRAHASKHAKELSGSKYQWWRSFQDLSTGRNGRMGGRRAAELHAPAAAAAAQRLVRGMLWVPIRQRRAFEAHNPRSSKPNDGKHQYLHQHPQPAAPQLAFRTLSRSSCARKTSGATAPAQRLGTTIPGVRWPRFQKFLCFP